MPIDPWTPGLISRPDQGEVIGTFIRAERLRLGITQRSLSEITGFSQPYLCQIEKGVRPSDKALLAIIDALGIDPADLPQYSQEVE